MAKNDAVDLEDIFADLDLEDAADDPFAVKPGTYLATVTEVTRVEGDEDAEKIEGTWNAIVFKYQIDEDPTDEESTAVGMPVSEWFRVPPKGETSALAKQKRAFLKRRLLGLGVPAEAMNTTRPEDLVDTEVVLKVKRSQGYTNVAGATRRQDDDGTDFPG